MRGIEFPDGIYVLDEGVVEGFATRLDFTGPDVSVVFSGTTATIAIAAAPATIEILDESISQGFADQLNFLGAGVSVVMVGTQALITIPAAPNTIDTQDEGAPLGASTALNFTGTGVTATFLAGLTTIDVPAGGGASMTAGWKFDNSTVAADPGNKEFRVNNATLASVTQIYINDTTTDNFDISTIAGFLAAGMRIYVQQKNDAARAALFQLTGAATDNGGWWTIPVTTLADGGILYQNNADCLFVFVLGAVPANSIEISDEGAPQGTALEIDFTGAGVTASVAAGVATVDIPGGSGSASITATTVTVSPPAYYASFTVVDATVAPASQIMVTWGNCSQSDANGPSMGEVEFNAIPGTGQFTLEVYSADRSKLSGAYKINYLVG